MDALTESLRTYLIYLGCLWGGTLVVAAIMAIFGGKWGAILGGLMGIVGGHLILLSTPAGIPVVLMESVVAILIIIGYIATHTYRSVEVIGEGKSLEQGPAWWWRPKAPIERAIEARGEADYKRLTGTREVIDVQRQLEGQRHEQLMERTTLQRLLEAEGNTQLYIPERHER